MTREEIKFDKYATPLKWGYNEAEIDMVASDAIVHLAVDDIGRNKAHCLVLSYGGGVVRDCFDVVSNGVFVVEVYVFEGNTDMVLWMERFGPDKVLEAVYVKK